MRVYRIAKQNFINDLSGEGARIYGGRWNKVGYNMVYFSEHLSLCVLELLAHIDYKFVTNNFKYIEVNIPDELIKPKLKLEHLDTSWRATPPEQYTKQMGANWLTSQKSLAMIVPSAILPSENNILLNPKHNLYSKIKVIKISDLDIDSRVL